MHLKDSELTDKLAGQVEGGQLLCARVRAQEPGGLLPALVPARRTEDGDQDGEAERGVLVCGSGVGAAVAASKIRGIRAAICHDVYSAHQGVEHDDMNVLCLGSEVVGPSLTADLVRTFLAARFDGEERHAARLEKIRRIEEGMLNG